MTDKITYDDMDRPLRNSGPRYDYRCTECGVVVERDFREATFVGRCDAGPEHYPHTALFKRVYTSFTYVPPLHEHYNHSVGKPIHSMRQFKDELKRSSDQHAEELGMDVNYQPVDLNDTAQTGATGEGIYESNVTRSREGNPLLREIPGEV